MESLIDERLACLEKAVASIIDRDGVPLTRKQAAWYIGRDPHTIDEYRRRGILTLYVVDGLVGYRRSELDKVKRMKQI